MSEQSVETQIALLQADMEALTKAVGKQSSDIEGLVKAWNTANGVVSFVKWLSGLIIAASVIWGAFKLKFFNTQ